MKRRHHDPTERVRIDLPFDEAIRRAMEAPEEPAVKSLRRRGKPAKAQPGTARKNQPRRAASH